MMALRSLGLALLLTLLLLGATASVDAQEPQPTRQPVPTPVATRTPAAQPLTTEEVAAMRAELETIREYDDRLLQTVQWAIGLMLTLLAAFVGLNLLGFFRLTDRDKNAIREELKAVQQQELMQLQQNVTRQSSELQKSVDERIVRMQQHLEERRVQFEEELTATSADAAESAQEVARSEAQSQFDELRRDLGSTQMSLLSMDASAWMQKTPPVVDNALIVYARLVDVASQGGWDWRVAEGLDGMKKALNAGAQSKARAAAEARDILSRVPDKYSAEVQALLAQLASARSTVASPASERQNVDPAS